MALFQLILMKQEELSPLCPLHSLLCLVGWHFLMCFPPTPSPRTHRGLDSANRQDKLCVYGVEEEMQPSGDTKTLAHRLQIEEWGL